MGGFGSGRWKGKERKLCVEDCEKQKATACPVCGRGVRFVYAPPSTLANAGFARRDWACRACHGLTYLSRQNWGTLTGDLANDPKLLARYAEAAESTLKRYTSMPPDLQTADQMMAWMDEREKQLKATGIVISMCNRLPEKHVKALLNGKIAPRPPRRRKKRQTAQKPK